MAASKFLTSVEEAEILEQFNSCGWIRNGQVLWTGNLREEAQQWADTNGKQTLTTAMGPLMKEDHPSCRKSGKGKCQWSMYIKGASAVFATLIARGDSVMVFTPPPPIRFNPNGGTNYQLIEEPILKAKSKFRIYLVHPMAEGARPYEFWPTDNVAQWTVQYGVLPAQTNWRKVKGANTPQLETLPTTQILGISDLSAIQPCFAHVAGQKACSSNSTNSCTATAKNSPKKKRRKSNKANTAGGKQNHQSCAAQKVNESSTNVKPSTKSAKQIEVGDNGPDILQSDQSSTTKASTPSKPTKKNEKSKGQKEPANCSPQTNATSGSGSGAKAKGKGKGGNSVDKPNTKKSSQIDTPKKSSESKTKQTVGKKTKAEKKAKHKAKAPSHKSKVTATGVLVLKGSLWGKKKMKIVKAPGVE